MATFVPEGGKANKPKTQRQVLDSLSDRLDVLVQDVERRNVPRAEASRPPITEAQALARCIDALHELREVERNRRSTSYSSGDYASTPLYSNGGWGADDRILRFLAARFGVSLIEIREVECRRPHADNIDAGAVLDAIQRSAQS